MGAILKTIEAEVSEDGTITPAEPVTGLAKAVLTLLVEEKVPNAETVTAMEECLDGLPGQPRFDTVEELMADLES